MDEIQKPLRSIADVAQRLNVSRPTVRRMIDRGDLPVVHVGPRLIRVPAEAVEQLAHPQDRKEN